ncbi:hypothetical protein QMTAC487_01960 [Sphaerotilus sp. FB-3]|nr:hypothetical protein QMTAC487_01960 [Sphaerotilus sp. FB-3]
MLPTQIHALIDQHDWLRHSSGTHQAGASQRKEDTEEIHDCALSHHLQHGEDPQAA